MPQQIGRVQSVDIYDEDGTYAVEDENENLIKQSTGVSPQAFVEHLFVILSENGMVSVNEFLKGVTDTGLRTSDPRLSKCMAKIETYRTDIECVEEDMLVDRETFTSFVCDDVDFIKKAYTGNFSVPEFHHFQEDITRVFKQCKQNTGGNVCTINPQLGKYDANKWGLAVCTVDGQRFGLGDSTDHFPIHSVTKCLLYALAMDEIGADENTITDLLAANYVHRLCRDQWVANGGCEVHKYVGQEPSGEISDMIKLDYNNRPHNPMINTGGITVCSLLKNDLRPADKFDFVSDRLKKLAGGEYIGFNNTVFLAEREVSDRNFALAYYLKENNCFPEGTNLRETMDFFNQMHAIESSCETMSVVAATLANGGFCPLTPEAGRIIDGTAVQHCLSLMHSCGMYDFSGQFAFKVGLPSKSGRSGMILLVVPNVCGMCMWSPNIDKSNNSVRGLQFCDELVNVFNFHDYDSLVHTRHKEDPRRRRLDKTSHVVTELLFGASNGDLSALTRMSMSGHVDMGIADYDGRTALHLAAAEGHLDVVKFLVESHPDLIIDSKDRFGLTPLDDAVSFDRLDVTEYLQTVAKSRPAQTYAGGAK